MNDGDIETYHAGGLWHNRVMGCSGVLSSHEIKAEARLAGRDYAVERGVEHVIRYLSGRVEAVNDYRPEESGIRV
ncbi:MAG: hypothetical protein AVDCRST_MAG75-3197 [uncultured Propionibacteriaceae bacterium]|uniref:DUF2188 domain-containing protein n=1 Tax=uncultured Propionibacteriaceae bacterium TaxID=257457 RepID=A0A6J4PN38_9ACTN|nr:MAG: hypothetical protein AVDCRST_MAG75-3197 [uncultured Propionibacteriaceae bacterium]